MRGKLTEVTAEAGGTDFAADEDASPTGWTAATVVAAVGMLLSFFLADSVARAQLSALGAGNVLLRLAPLFAASCVFCGWSFGAELAGVRSQAFGIARWAEVAMYEAQGLLMLVSGGAVLFQWATGSSSFQRALPVGILAALALPTACSFALQGKSVSNRSASEGQNV